MAAGVADGKVILLERAQNDTWSTREFQAHDGGINGLSWGPATHPCLLLAENNDYMNPNNEKAHTLVSKRFITGGMDGRVKMWQQNFDTAQFDLVSEIGAQASSQGGASSAHDDWVRDVAWCNNVGLLKDLVATVSED